MMDLVRRTRTEPRLRMGVSPRGAIALFRATRAYALLKGRTYLVPSDVQKLVVPCLAHRLLPIGSAGATFEAHEESAAILDDVMEAVPVPV
jgi:MoxR-like ATPase